MNVYGLREKADLSMCTVWAKKNVKKKKKGKHVIRVAINFAGMLLVACKQHMLQLDTLKDYD